MNGFRIKCLFSFVGRNTIMSVKNQRFKVKIFDLNCSERSRNLLRDGSNGEWIRQNL